MELLSVFWLLRVLSKELRKYEMKAIQKNTSDKGSGSVGTHISKGFTNLFLFSM